MSISAKQVMDLRAATGMPMMQCKRALEAEGGDFEKAIDRLRKEGMKAAEKRADRATAEGLVRVRVSPDHKRATLVAVACETEPVTKTELFTGFADVLVEHVDERAPSDLDALLAQAWVANSQETVDDVVKGLVAKIRENIRVDSIARLQIDGKGVVGGYQHHDQKNGAIVALSSDREDPALPAFAKQLCMHIVFSKPTALTREEIPESEVAHEREINRAQITEDPKMANKPAQVIDKILDGKMAAFFQQSVLTEQPWALPDSDETVGALLQRHGAKVRAFRRVQLGG